MYSSGSNKSINQSSAERKREKENKDLLYVLQNRNEFTLVEAIIGEVIFKSGTGREFCVFSIFKIVS